MSDSLLRRLRATGPLAALALLAGCNVPGARIHNIRELHEESGRHARSGNLVSGLEYYVRYAAADLFGDRLSTEPKADTFDTPLNDCVDNLIKLARVRSKDPRITAAQVSVLVWLAVDDSWKLSREACVRALGEHGERLGVRVPPPQDTTPAGVDEVRTALTELVAAVRASGPLVVPGGEPSSSGLAISPGLEASCARIEALHLDRNGALRLLRGVGALASGLDLDDARARRLLRTLTHLQDVSVSQTLLLALKDNAPREVTGSHPGWGSSRVRAAAVSACVQAFGDDALGELLLQLHLERDDEVVTAVLRAVAERGLPDPPAELPEETRRGLRERWVETVLGHAFDNPTGTVRVAAMRALERISGEPDRGLREEAWLAWYEDGRAARTGTAAAPTAPDTPRREARP